jgi:hypothetical protein
MGKKEHVYQCCPDKKCDSAVTSRQASCPNFDEVSLRQRHNKLDRLGPGGWLQSWWATLATGVLLISGAAVLSVQRGEIDLLKTSIEALRAASANAPSATSTPASTESQSFGAATETSEQEIARLKGAVSQLEAEVARSEETRSANDKMRTQLARSAAPTFTPEEIAAMDNPNSPKARAENIMCVNNLKQLGLAAKTWALDNTLLPPDVRSMSNEISNLKLLICPADHSRRPATDWSSVSSADSSYHYLAPSAMDDEPTRVMFLCPIHGHVCLCDGSVQSAVAKDHPERLVQRDWKLFYQGDAPPPTNPAPQPADGADSSP